MTCARPGQASGAGHTGARNQETPSAVWAAEGARAQPWRFRRFQIAGVSLPSPHPVEWFVLIGGLALVLRYRWLLDDAFVYFRYIDNAIFLRIGIVYNHGEFVEGFTSPAWLLVLAAVRATGLNFWYATLILGGLSFVVFWGLLVQLDRQMVAPTRPLLNFPLLYLGSNYAVLTYFTSGVETPLVQAIAVCYALYVVNPRSRALQVAVGISPLVRPELLLPLILAIVWGCAREKCLPKTLLVSVLLGPGAWLAFRVFYYADLLPNTFYLKNELDIRQGLLYVRDTFETYHWLGLAVAAVVSLWLLHRREPTAGDSRLAQRGAMLVAALSVTLYVVKIGGDPRHYRYLAFPFCLAACAFAGVFERWVSTLAARVRVPAPAVAVGLFVLCALPYPPQLDAHPITLREQHTVVNKINDASLHRHYDLLKYESWGPAVATEKLVAYRESRGPRFRYANTMADPICALAYQRFYLRIVQSFGLTEPILARTVMRAQRPAHKTGLVGLANDLVAIYQTTTVPGRGMYRAAVEERRAAPWITHNLEAIDVIERKTFNHHDPLENLRLAFTFPPRIQP